MDGLRTMRAIAAMLCVAIAGMAGPRRADAQVVRLAEQDTGAGPEILARALGLPHVLIEPASTTRVLSADSTISRTVIALGRSVIVEGTVHGDVIVVGGDLYMHPGGRIDGRAVAIGGGVYESMLAHTGPVSAFRDFTYDITPVAGGYSLSYRALSIVAPEPAFGLSGIYGLQLPTYDRSNGLSLPIGARVVVPGTPIEIEPRLTYRSQLGRLDPSVAVGAPLGRRTTVRLDLGRGTFTNDAWIWTDLVNGAEFFLVGDDARNYFRAERGELVVTRRYESATATFEPYAGIRAERAASVRPDSNARGGPWTLLSRNDRDDRLRPNPAINPGDLGSVLFGARWNWAADQMTARANIEQEVADFAENCPYADGFSACPRTLTFAQTTIDASIAFPTFGTQTLRIGGHIVATAGGATPRQRYAYLGGPGSIPTLDLLERGGDELVFIDAYYNIPFERIVIPIVGSPILTLRETLGGATIRQFPTLAQATGVRVSVGFAYVEVMVDPVNRHVFKGVGLSVIR